MTMTANDLTNAVLEVESARQFLLRTGGSKTVRFEHVLAALVAAGWKISQQRSASAVLLKQCQDRKYTLYASRSRSYSASASKEFVMPDKFGNEYLEWQEFELEPDTFWPATGESSQDFAGRLDDEICCQPGPAEPTVTERDYDDEND